jgi:phage-related protein
MYLAPILDGALNTVTGKVSDLADSLETTISEKTSSVTKRADDLSELTNKVELDDLTDTFKLSDLSDLETTVAGLTSDVSKRGDADLSDISDSLDLSDLTNELDLTKLSSGLTKRQDEDVVDDVPAGDISRRLLGLDDLLSPVTDLLSEITGLTNSLESTLHDLIEDVEAADVEGVLADVEGLADDLLAKVQAIVKESNTGLDLSTLQPTLNGLSDEIGNLVKEVQSLLDLGVVSNSVAETTGVLEDALRLVENLLSVETLVGSS